MKASPFIPGSRFRAAPPLRNIPLRFYGSGKGLLRSGRRGREYLCRGRECRGCRGGPDRQTLVMSISIRPNAPRTFENITATVRGILDRGAPAGGARRRSFDHLSGFSRGPSTRQLHVIHFDAAIPTTRRSRNDLTMTNSHALSPSYCWYGRNALRPDPGRYPQACAIRGPPGGGDHRVRQPASSRWGEFPPDIGPQGGYRRIWLPAGCSRPFLCQHRWCRTQNGTCRWWPGCVLGC